MKNNNWDLINPTKQSDSISSQPYFLSLGINNRDMKCMEEEGESNFSIFLKYYQIILINYISLTFIYDICYQLSHSHRYSSIRLILALSASQKNMWSLCQIAQIEGISSYSISVQTIQFSHSKIPDSGSIIAQGLWLFDQKNILWGWFCHLEYFVLSSSHKYQLGFRQNNL